MLYSDEFWIDERMNDMHKLQERRINEQREYEMMIDVLWIDSAIKKYFSQRETCSGYAYAQMYKCCIK